MARDLVSEIDLHKHGVLEAHAGTGKTYTIVGLVVRLLVERRLAVRDILLVTYTQKAAGELLGRIREGLEKASRAHPDATVREHLRTNLANLHEALVGTIHGVCLRLLRAFPFESGLPFVTELVDDGEGVEICLREALRSDDWKGRFADPSVLRWVLAAKDMETLLKTASPIAVALLDGSARVHPPGLESMDEVEDGNRLAGCFAARWALEGARRWNAKKSAGGFLSYQDMLGLMEKALERPEFLAAMRSQAKVGIVDEFQDTSSRQWNIFRKWFLAPAAKDDRLHEAGSHLEAGNLYVVGDPKQSIYSFQGADVRTYQAACRELMERPGARRYRLDENWRSLPTMIAGYNSLFCDPTPEGWFLDGSIRYEAENQARAPARASIPSRILSSDLMASPVRLVRLVGSAAQVRESYARQCAEWILALRGRLVDLPEGDAWKARALDWSDFAIVVSSRSAAKAFYRILDEHKIPWALYKQQGVFASRAALEVGAVLRAICAPAHDTGVRSLALATRILEGDEEILETLRELALSRKWARMIRVLSEVSGASARMVGSAQGDRQWMDLRQVLEFALEYLLAGTGGLTELVEHLARLKDEREKADEDRNMLASATDRGRVQILTMHVSKGLEFPVVFLAASGPNNKQQVKSWIEDGPDGPALRLMPAFLDSGKSKVKDAWQQAVLQGESEAKRRRDQEERRLFYVAITRPKLLLVVPCHEQRNNDGALSAKMPALSRSVHAHLDNPGPGVALLGAVPEFVEQDQAPPEFVATPPVRVRTLAELEAVGLPGRSRVQTSYTQVAKTSAALHGLDGRLRRSEESDSPENTTTEIVADAWLPRGAKTGDALHEILEEWMDPSHDNSWLQIDPVPEAKIAFAARTLALHGLDGALGPRVAQLLVSVLRAPLTLPSGRVVRLCEIGSADRRPETEFHWAFGPDGKPAGPQGPVKGWMVGYIDLLFRIDKIWYVLDWKTTSMGGWDAAALTESVVEHAYDLQAKLYGRTVASALPPGETFGGAIVLYLRAFADPATSGSGAWVAGPSEDGDEIARRLRAWLHERGRFVSGGAA
jgi:exodeoxyribonuclease V beta subunit